MNNVKRHIHNRINYLVKYQTPTLGSFENWNTVHIAQIKLNSEVRNQIINAQPMLIKEGILKKTRMKNVSIVITSKVLHIDKTYLGKKYEKVWFQATSIMDESKD